MGTGIIGLAPKRLREYFGEQIFSYPPATRHREALAKWVPSMHESTVLGGLVPHTESTALGALEPLAESTALGGLVPRTEHAALGGLPLTSATFHHFRAHDPCTGIDGLSASPGRFVARVSASVATTKSCTGRRSISHAADTGFASVFAIPIEGSTGSAKKVSVHFLIRVTHEPARGPAHEPAIQIHGLAHMKPVSYGPRGLIHGCGRAGPTNL